MISKRISNFLSGRGTLLGQARSRLLLVGIIASSAISLVAINNYNNQFDNEAQQKRTANHQYYEKILPQIEARWKGEAEQVKARIEFSRILEDVDGIRWKKLEAFLNAQSEFTHFSNILIARKDGRLLFQYGQEAHKLNFSLTQDYSGWHYSQDARELYRVYSVPIWMGIDGQATLILLKTINNAELRLLAAPETHTHLFFNNHLLASSDGNRQSQIVLGEKEIGMSNGLMMLQSELTWPGEGLQPTLVVQRELHIAYPLKQFLLRPLFAILIIIALIWVGLGRWLTNTIKRLEKLEMGAEEYSMNGQSATATPFFKQALAQPDEIADLASTMEILMNKVEERSHEQEIYLETLSMLEEAVLEINCDGILMRASPGWNKLAHSDDTIGKRFDSFLHSEDRELMQEQCLVLSGGEKQYLVLRLRLSEESSNHSTWLESKFICIYDNAGKVAGLRGVLRDITQTYLHEKQITHMALHDALTGLPNRILLEDRIGISLRQAARAKTKVGICFIDLDHFKNVNDTLGHKSGDKILLTFAERLGLLLREGDTVARWGGDEFVILLPDMKSEQDIRDVARKMSDHVINPLQIEDAEMAMTFSMGVAIYPDDGEDMESLFSQADRAMFYAKAQGRNQTCFFRDMTAKGIGKKELYIQNRLATAINSNKIQAWLQPVMDAVSGCCSGVEVLARWHDEDHGWISPATFIPMAENLGLIQELGQQILLSSLASARQLMNEGREFTVAINVSKRQLFTPYFTQRLNEEVTRQGINPQLIILEVTESIAMLDVEHAADRVKEIRQAGFQIALDDFGTGYSSLSQLHEMQVDELKIDISFVRRLNEPNGLSMTQAIINLAQALGLKTVAEGVETADASRKLREMGVNKLQGYFFGKPMPVNEFRQWMASQN